MTTAEQNYILLQEIEANRRFLLMAYQQNPKLLELSEARIRELIEMPAHSADKNLSSDLRPLSSERGVTLIELVMFIVIVSIAVTGVLLVMNRVTGHSADALVRKQALAIAESLLEEIELQDFTNPTGGFTPAIPGSPTRFERTNFDDVTDYNGFATTGIYAVDGVTAVAGLGSYNVSPPVQVVPIAAGELGALLPANAVRIAVTVTDPTGQQTVATGYRTAY